MPEDHDHTRPKDMCSCMEISTNYCSKCRKCDKCGGYVPLISKQRRDEIITKAVRDAEITLTLKNKTWYVEARIGSENYRGRVVRFIDDRRGTADNGYDNMPVEEYIAGLLVDIEYLKLEVDELKNKHPEGTT